MTRSNVKVSWYSTFAFREFRAGLTRLSRVYWTHQLGADLLEQAVRAHKGKAGSISAELGSVTKRMLHLSAADMQAWLPECSSLSRVHMLVVCSAILEAYVNTAAFLHVAKSHLVVPGSAGPIELTRVGDEIVRPIRGRSALSASLDYAPHLFGVNLGAHRGVWDVGYKIRCAIAHNGGVVDKKAQNNWPKPKPAIGEAIKLTWDQLRKYMDAADQIATTIDNVVASGFSRGLEGWQILRDLRDEQKCPPQTNVWKCLHDDYGISRLSEDVKKMIINDIYGRR